MVSELVSIVLPVHNGERFLHQSLESCLAQTYGKLEVVVVDDGSHDATLAIVTEVAARDARVRFYRHRKNRGLPAALNTGFALARGTYLAWTSDDNAYRPNAIAELVETLEREPAVDIIAAEYSVIDDEGRMIREERMPQPGSPPNVLLHGNFVGPCALFRRQVQEVVGQYALDCALAEDYEYWLRAAAVFRVSYLKRDLYLYREHTGSLSTRHYGEVGVAAQRALSRNLRRHPWLGRRRLLGAYRGLGSLALRRRDVRAFAAHCVQAVHLIGSWRDLERSR